MHHTYDGQCMSPVSYHRPSTSHGFVLNNTLHPADKPQHSESSGRSHVGWRHSAYTKRKSKFIRTTGLHSASYQPQEKKNYHRRSCSKNESTAPDVVNGAKEGRAVLLAPGDEEVVPQRVEIVSMAHEGERTEGIARWHVQGHKTKQILLIGNHGFFSDPAKCGNRGRRPVLRLARALGNQNVVNHSATTTLRVCAALDEQRCHIYSCDTDTRTRGRASSNGTCSPPITLHRTPGSPNPMCARAFGPQQKKNTIV